MLGDQEQPTSEHGARGSPDPPLTSLQHMAGVRKKTRVAFLSKYTWGLLFVP